MNVLEKVKAIRTMSNEQAEAEYVALREKLQEDYQHIAGSAGRNRMREIEKLKGFGGRHGEKGDRLADKLSEEVSEYHDGVTMKSLLAVLNWPTRMGRHRGSSSARLT